MTIYAPSNPTPRPWTIRPGTSTHIVSGYIEYSGRGHAYETVVRQDSDMRVADAELIVLAVNKYEHKPNDDCVSPEELGNVVRQRDELYKALRLAVKFLRAIKQTTGLPKNGVIIENCEATLKKVESFK